MLTWLTTYEGKKENLGCKKELDYALIDVKLLLSA